jgi:site-specific DNA recombinase
MSLANIYQSYDTQTQYKALIYCRVSSLKQTTDGAGLQSQQHRCLMHAQSRNYEVEKTFLESVSGGLSIAERPALNELITYLKQHQKSGNHYVVIFDDHKRFARETSVHIELRKTLAMLGAKVEYLNFAVENTPEGIFIDTMLAAQSQLEREQIGRQTKEKTKARLEKGFWTFRAPVGYKYVASKQGGKELAKDEPLATIVKEALEGFANGRFRSVAEVKRFLEHDPHFPKDLPNGELRQQTVVRMMDKILYAGYLQSDTHNVSLRKAQHEPIISLETFERVQERRQQSGYLATRKGVCKDFVLRGAIHCHECENPLRSCWSKGKYKHYPYYICHTKGCGQYGKSIARDKLEGQFDTFLQTVQPQRSVFAMVKDMFKHAWTAQTEHAAMSIQTYKQEATKTEKEIKSLISRIVATDNNRVIAAYEERIEELEKKKAILQERAAQKAPSPESFDKIIELSMAFLSSPYKLWTLGGYDMKRLVLKLAFSHGVYYDRNAGDRTPLKATPHKAFMPFLGGVLQDGATGEN